jgi:ferredoxin
MIMTLATKIMFGAAPGLLKARYHAQYMKQPDFADMLLDILSIVPPHLVIMDGIMGMQGDGPMSGEPVRLDTILASDHPIAIDLAVCEMLSIEPMGIPVLKKANIRKLWPEQITYPLLSPEQVRNHDFILPSTAGYLLSEEKTALKSPVITKDCVSCGECVEICPKNAITIKTKKAHIDYSKCIRCYCCHEVCTYRAISLNDLNK